MNTIDFAKWTDKELKARFGNCEKREDTDLARAILSPRPEQLYEFVGHKARFEQS
jgi:hypothetical protein